MTNLKISTMTGKLKNIDALNTSSLDNPFCEKMSLKDTICKKCYSRKMLKTSRQNCRKPWKNNGAILSHKIIDSAKIVKTNSKYFRFSAHGELLNYTHLENLMNIAKTNPDTQFALWTKRKNLINKYLALNVKPSNINLIYSNPKIDVKGRVPANFDKVFNVFSKGTKVNINCGSTKCFDCAVCYTKNNVKVVNEVIK